MGNQNNLGSILVGDFIFGYFMGSIFKNLVVGFFAVDVRKAIKNSLFVFLLLTMREHSWATRLLFMTREFFQVMKFNNNN
mgnify:CR=1 FL=1